MCSKRLNLALCWALMGTFGSVKQTETCYPHKYPSGTFQPSAFGVGVRLSRSPEQYCHNTLSHHSVIYFFHQFHQPSSISRTFCSHLTGTNAATEPTNTSVPCGKVVLTGLCCAQRNPQSTATSTQAFWLCLSPRIVCAFDAAITVTFTQKRASQWHRFGAIISRGEVWSGPLRPCFLIFMRCAMPLCGQSQPRLFQASLSTSVLPLTGELNGYAGKRKSWNFGFHSKAFN